MDQITAIKENLEATLLTAFEYAQQLHNLGDTRYANVKGNIANTLGLINPVKALSIRGQISQLTNSGSSFAVSNNVAGMGGSFSTDLPPKKGVVELPTEKKNVGRVAKGGKGGFKPAPAPFEAKIDDSTEEGGNPELTVEVPPVIQAAKSDGRIEEEAANILDVIAGMSTHDIVSTYKDSLDNILKLLNVDEELYRESKPMQKGAMIKQAIESKNE